MNYKNGFKVQVGDIAIRSNGTVVLVTAVSDSGFYGLSKSGESICFCSKQEAEHFSLHSKSILRDTFNKLKNVSSKEWFDSLPYEHRKRDALITDALYAGKGE